MAQLKLENGRYFPAEGIVARSRSGAPTIGHNTRLERLADDRIGVRYHATLIYAMTLSGWAVIDCDGWRSVTTLQRINALLPAPWRIGSYGKRGTWLWSSGRPVAPFEDGLAVHVGNASSATAFGTVGYSTDRGAHVSEILTAAEVSEIIAAADTAQTARELKRAERLLREHPTARPVTYRADLAHSRAYGASSSPMPNPHKMSAWRAENDCDRCREEREAWRTIRAEILTADHDDGHAWAVTVNGGTITEPAGKCPYDCPSRDPNERSW